MKKVAIYARVSTSDQDCGMQLSELRAYCMRNQWEAAEYVETASGKAGSRRPVFAQLMRDAELKRFDVVLVWKLDRFGRSLSDFVANVRQLDAWGIRFLAPSQGIDTDQKSPFAKMMMNMLAVFAEFERELIVERVTAGVREYRANYSKGKIGIERASRTGKNLKHGRPKKIFRRDLALEMRKAGYSWRKIGKELSVPASTVRLALEQAA